ncbi:MAG: GTPase ObgE [Candidatus Gracilibacteria bacterium]
MFFDEVNLELEGGRGGAGGIYFHREKYVDHGPPDGGNGGSGGNVIFEADENFNTLQHFMGRKHFSAGNGENGYKNDMAGKNAIDLVLKVPIGTILYDSETKEKVVDLIIHGQKCLIAHGGRGGFGNGHFMSSTRQAPAFGELGDVGEERKVKLELRLFADVGLVGFPSAGKSTLIAHVSSARPKIAAYPFTTLVPNLGVANLSKFGGDKSQSFVIADIPGIIEGASQGKGLGNTFLKHISRTAILLFLLDPFAYNGLSMADQFKTLQAELKAHNPELLDKDFFVAMNKIDSIPDADRTDLSKAFLKAFPKIKSRFRMVSGVSGEGMSDLIFDLFKAVQKNHKAEIKNVEVPVPDMIDYKPSRFLDEESFEISHMYTVDATRFEEPICGQIILPEALPNRELYKVTGQRIEQISRMTNPVYPDAVKRVLDVLLKIGAKRALLKAGINNGDYIKIGPHFFEFHDV